MGKNRLHTDIRHNVWELLHHTNALLIKYTDVKLLEERSISYQQFMVLYMMNRIGNTATATQIAELLNRNPNTLSMILDRMEASGPVKKLRDRKDRRIVRIVMTKQGKNKLEETIESGQVIIEKLAAPFSEEELQKFASLIEKLLDQIYEVLVPQKVTQKMKTVNTRRVQSNKS